MFFSPRKVFVSRRACRDVVPLPPSGLLHSECARWTFRDAFSFTFAYLQNPVIHASVLQAKWMAVDGVPRVVVTFTTFGECLTGVSSQTSAFSTKARFSPCSVAFVPLVSVMRA